MSCDYCREIYTNPDDLEGTDGILYNEKEQAYYHYAEYFQGEKVSIPITHCPNCGEELGVVIIRINKRKSDLVKLLNLIDYCNLYQLKLLQYNEGNSGELSYASAIDTDNKVCNLIYMGKWQFQGVIKKGSNKNE
jgi:hypothetical protein